jgi:iron(III) transport system substrate-binding protein
VDYPASATRSGAWPGGGPHPLRAGVATPPGVKRVSDIRAMEVDYGRVAEEMERIQPWLRQWSGL